MTLSAFLAFVLWWVAAGFAAVAWECFNAGAEGRVPDDIWPRFALGALFWLGVVSVLLGRWWAGTKSGDDGGAA